MTITGIDHWDAWLCFATAGALFLTLIVWWVIAVRRTQCRPGIER